MGALLGGQGQAGGMGVPQAQGGTGMTGASPMAGMGQQGDPSGLLTILQSLLGGGGGVAGAGQPGILSMLLTGGMGQGQGQGGTPQGQGYQGDIGGTQASMNPSNYMTQTNPQPPMHQ